MNTLKFYNDRTNLDKLPNGLKDFLLSKEVVNGSDINIHFVGLVYFEDKLYVFLPRNSDLKSLELLSTDERKSIIRNLMTSISIYQQAEENSIRDDDRGDEIIGGQKLALIISILDDFNINGLYTRRVKKKITNSGKINWRRTIGSHLAYLSEDSPLYLEYEGVEKRSNFENEISKIHSRIILEIIRDLGWIFYSDSSCYENTLSVIRQSELSSDDQLIAIKKELEVSYSERDIFLLNSIYQYILNMNSKENTDLVIGIKKFQGMWEHMIGSVLYNKIDVNKSLVAPVYKISNKYILASARGQKTDVVLNYNNKYVIIDAKYYKASNIYDVPGLPDIVKQFYYADTLSLIKKEVEDIKNVFIFPGKYGVLQSIHMALKGKTIHTQMDCLDERYDPIICIYQDPIELIACFARRGKAKFLFQKIMDAIIFNVA